MGCEHRSTPEGEMIICSRGRRPVCPVSFCGRSSVALCDYPVERKGQQTTCDSPICASHRHPVPGQSDTDWCEAHWQHDQREQRAKERVHGDETIGQ